MKKIYAIVGLDADGHIDSAGAFESKSDAWKFFLDNNLGSKITKAAVLLLQVKEKSDEVAEATGQVRPPSKSVAISV